MNESFYFYYTPELIITLFVAFIVIGLVIGFLLWGSAMDRAFATQANNDKLAKHVYDLKKEQQTLRDRLSLFD